MNIQINAIFRPELSRVAEMDKNGENEPQLSDFEKLPIPIFLNILNHLKKVQLNEFRCLSRKCRLILNDEQVLYHFLKKHWSFLGRCLYPYEKYSNIIDFKLVKFFPFKTDSILVKEQIEDLKNKGYYFLRFRIQKLSLTLKPFWEGLNAIGSAKSYLLNEKTGKVVESEEICDPEVIVDGVFFSERDARNVAILLNRTLP